MPDMNLPEVAARRLDAYLREVERHLAHKSPAVRREVVDELRNHVLEALQHEGGGPPTAERVEAILAGMDAPECFAETPVDLAAPPAPAPVRPPARSLPALAPLLIAFVLGYGLATWHGLRTARPVEVAVTEGETVAAETEPEKPPLLLGQVEQINLTATPRDHFPPHL
jgi:hypothetical protein